MRPQVRDFFTGVVAILALVALAFTLFRFGEFSGALDKRIRFSFRVDNAGGISSTSYVSMQGVRIGNVKGLENDTEDPTHPVRIMVEVFESARVPRDFTIFLERGLVGDATLDLRIPDRPDALAPANLVKPGEDLKDVRRPASLLSQLQDRISGPLTSVASTAEDINKLTRTYTRVGERVEQLLAPRTAAEVAAGAEPTLPSLMARLDLTLHQADAWLGDEQLRAGAAEAVKKANAFLDEAGQTAKAWKETAKTIDAQAAASSAKLAEAADQTASTLRKFDAAAEQITEVAGSINRGEGTLGQLAKNPDLYRSMQDAARRLDAALTELQLLLKKFKEEGIDVKF